MAACKGPVKGAKMPRHTAPAHFYGYNIFKVFYLASVLGVFCTPLCHGLPTARMALQQNMNQFFNGNNVCITSYDANTDYFPEKVAPNTPDQWSVQYYNSYKIAENKYLNATYILYQCGAPAPTVNITQYQTSNNSFVQTMAVPRRTLAVDETVPLAMLELLGYVDDITYIANATTQYITSPCIQKLIKDKGASIILADDLETQKKQLQEVDLHIATPYGNKEVQNEVIFTATEDPTTLKRAEWIEFLSVFLNLEDAAKTYFTTVRNNYDELQQQAAPINPKPVIAYITAYDGTYTVDETPYKQQYMSDAGGQPLKGGDFTNLTAFHDAIRSADVIIDEAYWPTGTKTFNDFLGIYQIPANATDFKFVATQSVYGIDGRVNPNNFLDWFEGAVVRADKVLEDFVSTLHPRLLPSNFKRTWLRRYASETQTIVTAADCPTPTIAGPGAAATGTDSNAVDAGVGVDPSLVAVGRKQDVAV